MKNNDTVTVRVSGATKAFGSHTLWRDLSFEAHGGTLTALRGRSGSGKTTLLNAIGGLETVDAGTVEVVGRDVTRLPAAGRRRLRKNTLGFVFQDYALVENTDVEANLAVVYGLLGARRHRDAMDAALTEVGLSGFRRRPIRELSGGERQRVALARLLLKNPNVVLADEPTGSLDAENTLGVIEVLRRLANRGAAVLIVTHDRQVAEACDAALDLDATGEAVRSG
ncbi:MAG: ATP-binding cassette domain-containing protein [Mobilicoccus sp.]|nr:ATP-binding cassette domain-containing protein [Mobilicoccus sp.]